MAVNAFETIDAGICAALVERTEAAFVAHDIPADDTSESRENARVVAPR